MTFADLQTFFRTLENRLRSATSAQLMDAADDVELELYAGGTGVIRTYNGWCAVSGYSTTASGIRFTADTSAEIAPNALDREIVTRATRDVTGGCGSGRQKRFTADHSCPESRLRSRQWPGRSLTG